MKKVLLMLVFGCTANLVLAQEPLNRSDLYEYQIKKIKDDIFLAYRKEPLRHFVEGNVTIIINEKDVVLVDGGGSPTSAMNIIAAVKKLTKNPIRYVINTHDHVDHTLGNQEYVRSIPGVEIISHSLAVQGLVEDGTPYVKRLISNFDSSRIKIQSDINKLKKEKKPGYEKIVAYQERYIQKDIFVRRDEYLKAVITPATLICDEKITLQRGKRVIEIMSIGHGDTPGDLIVYLPNDKLVCSGDMVVHPVPYGFSPKPLEWITTLKKLLTFDFDFLVPGHGELQNGKTYVNDVIELLQSVQSQVQTGIDKGIVVDSLKKQVDLTKFTNKYLNEDPVALYRFKTWFSNPAIVEAYKMLSTPEK